MASYAGGFCGRQAARPAVASAAAVSRPRQISYSSGAVNVNDLVLFVPVVARGEDGGPSSSSSSSSSSSIDGHDDDGRGGTVVWQALFGVDDVTKCFLNQETSTFEPVAGGYGFEAVLAAARRALAVRGGGSSDRAVSPPPIDEDAATTAAAAAVTERGGASSRGSDVHGLTAPALASLLGRADMWQRLLLCGTVVHSKDCVRPERPEEGEEQYAAAAHDDDDEALGMPAVATDHHHHHYGVEPGESYRLLTVIPPE
jgi:hypothetical protein